MTNLEKYDKLFMDNFKLTKEQLPGLKYRSIKLWDSMGHMQLMEEMEDIFDISLDTPDVLSFSSYEKGLDILRNYGVDI
ncbi:MAG: acyl carrier protein [Megasphaera sp.]|uniref:acyl carrier protein n=1 Tax=Megasphaera sueciensis TaxID=349094 RepID=UPI003CFF9B54|nr:acyl carrier protein [Megasphaera sp.]MCI1823919.1 acyl carrier protein [Megasphaera sp.]